MNNLAKRSYEIRPGIGGSEFIGSRVVRALLEHDSTVRALDNLSNGSEANLSPRVELITGDICDPKTTKGPV